MRNSFENSLRGYSKSSKDMSEVKEVKRKRREGEFVEDGVEYESLETLKNSLKEKLKIASNNQNNNQETQQEIYKIQVQKQEIMEQLKLDLDCVRDEGIDCGVENIEGVRLVEYDEVEDSFNYIDGLGEGQSASFIEIVTDIDWDVYYNFGPSTPKKYKKQYIVAKTKKRLQALLDQQIIASETANIRVDTYKKEAYESIEKDRESGSYKEKSGFISEIMVKNFLRQMSADNDLPFDVFDADVYQDVAEKMDLVIHRTEQALGVKVEASEHNHDIGIQFTLNAEAAEDKMQQIANTEKRLRRKHAEITEIALVVFPEIMVQKLKKQWEAEGKKAGGPGKYMTLEIQHKLFSELLKRVFSEDDTEAFWKSLGKGGDGDASRDELKKVA
jgi:hypothetical protein